MVNSGLSAGRIGGPRYGRLDFGPGFWGRSSLDWDDTVETPHCSGLVLCMRRGSAVSRAVFYVRRMRAFGGRTD
jgi:hypothetical protein